eukprot:gene14385-19046_t
MSTLFDPVQAGDLKLANRIVMAPLTRNRSPNAIPPDIAATYYAQRASAGLLITEASQVVPEGKGYPSTPGVYSPEQIAGWRKVTDAVHAAGGKIVLQLWFTGRISHSSFQPNHVSTVSASAIKPEGHVYLQDWSKADYETPRALTVEEIPGVVAGYAQGAANAKAAGFDGVEIHAANGYLIDQFLRDGSNTRTDAQELVDQIAVGR